MNVAQTLNKTHQLVSSSHDGLIVLVGDDAHRLDQPLRGAPEALNDVDIAVPVIYPGNGSCRW